MQQHPVGTISIDFGKHNLEAVLTGSLKTWPSYFQLGHPPGRPLGRNAVQPVLQNTGGSEQDRTQKDQNLQGNKVVAFIVFHLKDDILVYANIYLLDLSSVYLILNSVYVMLSFIYITQGSIYLTQGSIYTTQGSIYITQGSIYLTLSSIYVTLSSIYVTLSYITQAY